MFAFFEAAEVPCGKPPLASHIGERDVADITHFREVKFNLNEDKIVLSEFYQGLKRGRIFWFPKHWLPVWSATKSVRKSGRYVSKRS